MHNYTNVLLRMFILENKTKGLKITFCDVYAPHFCGVYITQFQTWEGYITNGIIKITCLISHGCSKQRHWCITLLWSCAVSFNMIHQNEARSDLWKCYIHYNLTPLPWQPRLIREIAICSNSAHVKHKSSNVVCGCMFTNLHMYATKQVIFL